jgi:spermidine/putrescine transport system ATP-binding protein
MAVEAGLAAPLETGGATAPPDVRLDNVTKRFDDVVAVDGLTLEVPHGRFFALLGPSGCGKTTTLRMIGGFEDPSEGTIFLGDRDVTDLPPYRRDVNTVFQSYALFPHLSIFENVAFGLRRRGVKGQDLRKQVGRILELVQLSGFERRKPRQLSGGQQQRIALARALVNSPRVLLLDEPLGALDLKLRKEMQLFIKALQHDLGITFIHVTHDQEEAMTMADSIAVMNSGHIEQLGSPDDLYERPATGFVARFLGVSNLLEGEAAGDGTVRLSDGTTVQAPASSGRRGKVSVGIRPEKIRLDDRELNTLAGEVRERAYIGVSTQYIVDTAHGAITIYVQNSDPRASAVQPGDQVTLSWSPEATFVVDPEEGKRNDGPALQ